MTSTKAKLGTVLNKDQVADKRSGKVAASTSLAVGLVYQDGANGWKQVPTNASVLGRRCYWNETAIDNSAGALGDKTGTFYGEGAKVVFKADVAITLDTWLKPSTNTAGEMMALGSDPAATVSTVGTVAAQINEITTWQTSKVALYIGHVLEISAADGLATDAVDNDEDCVAVIRKGG